MKTTVIVSTIWRFFKQTINACLLKSEKKINFRELKYLLAFAWQKKPNDVHQ